jgi:hypothetical protein
MKNNFYLAIMSPQPEDDYEYSSSYNVPEWASNIWFVLIIIVPLVLLRAGVFRDKNGDSVEGCFTFGFFFAVITIVILNIIF